MESIRRIIKSKTPASVMMPVIQTILSLPPAAARYLIADFTAPTKSQRDWVQMVEYSDWRGAWIGSDMSKCKGIEQKIKEADLIIYEAHAPEFTYPVPVLECVAAYEYLINTLKVPGSKIILSGDSAGGALCLETLVRVYAPGILTDIHFPRTNYRAELPAGLFLVSPLVSANTASWLWEFTGDIITPVLANRVLKEYLNLPEANPSELHVLKLAHIRSGFARFAPKNILIYVGEREVMRDDILSLANTVKKDEKLNVQIRKENYEHDWYFIREIVKAQDRYIVDEADSQFVDFVASSVMEKALINTKVINASTENAFSSNTTHLIPEQLQAENESVSVVPPVTA
ncbi:hypothetical protein CU098_003635 [Rhizopus stolonifer]|uniref:Alpha/beta hydrolase fold-3 domain-containing protein n=1 Tax=Rhizopus stolonifer TaxID=4846 RepID=A0A367IM75_RHIST|nr:hypothetical protein CU098_003635 [Rhizopus stolonifer]